MCNIGNMVGSKIKVGDRLLAVIGYNRSKDLVTLLVLRLSGPDEIQEGSSYTVTSKYLKSLNYKIVESFSVHER